jgi:trans-aconitate methyltransferase
MFFKFNITYQMETSNKAHWETIYTTKTPEQVSWTQEKPAISLELIEAVNLPKFSKIIDIGGGDSLLVDFLLEAGYSDITVLDISQAALDRAKKRLGSQAALVTWICSDILDFKPSEMYQLWHDRAAFHFLTNEAAISTYVDLTSNHAQQLVIGTFSETGPLKCSGLEIKQYTEQAMSKTFEANFQKIECVNSVHTTPFDSTQDFIFCRFRRNAY